MTKLHIVIALTAVVLSGSAVAHPTDILFDSFGECNAALNQQNKEDRIDHADAFPNNGAAEIRMLNNWQCVYDSAVAAWHMSGQPYGGDLLGNGNGQADPGTGGQ